MSTRIPTFAQPNVATLRGTAANVPSSQRSILDLTRTMLFEPKVPDPVDLAGDQRTINPLELDIDKAYPGMNITPTSSDEDLLFVLNNDLLATQGRLATESEIRYWVTGNGPNDPPKFRSTNDSDLVTHGQMSAMSYWHGRITGLIQVGPDLGDAVTPTETKPTAVATAGVSASFSSWLNTLADLWSGMDFGSDSSDADLRKLVKAGKAAAGGGEPTEAEYQSGVASLRAAIAGVSSTGADGQPLAPAALKELQFKAALASLDGSPLNGPTTDGAPVTAEVRSQRLDAALEAMDLKQSILSRRTIAA